MNIMIEGLACLEGGDISLKVKLSDAGNFEIKNLVVPPEEWRRLGLAPGRVLSESEFDELESAADFRKAVIKGLELLAYGANSRRAIERKLKMRGHDPEIAARAADYLAEKRYINESSDAQSVLRSGLAKGYGRSRIIMKLREGGYGEEAISEVREQLEEIDFVARCADLVRKKYGSVPADKKAAEKIAASLVRYGYSYSEIKDAFRLLAQERE